ncbi:hypothetical protein [Magnetospirillum sp. 15-1]|uniref:hypothetical protein n=1 Tax=Magnetospirillum sp. 15-1 TaxID=1979370 RepID=UPI0011446E53|nr:hypothetical protein [Magnetospirillum sp. 15-1]
MLPDLDHIRALVEFAASWDQASPLMAHCEAGISRSGATAFVLCQTNPGREAEVADLLARAPHLLPNQRMIALVDCLLGCDGRMIAASDWQVGMVPEDNLPICALPAILPTE